MNRHPSPPYRRKAVGFLLGVAVTALAPATWARSVAELPYPVVDVWPSAVRFLRIDRGFPIREKDESSGYILFDFVDGDKKYGGSLELIRTTNGDGRDETRAALSLPALPRHFETMLLDKLGAKVKDDRGSPAPPPPRKPPAGETKPSPDGGPRS